LIRAYLAGPDVFLPDAVAHAGRKIAICARHGVVGRAPLNEDLDALTAMSADDAWWTIYRKDMAMMAECEIVIANLTPFRGASADAGTLIEVGWFLGQGRPIFGYSNVAAGFAARSRAQVAAVPDAMAGLAAEGFGLADNLMIEGAVVDGSGSRVMRPERDLAFASLEMFEACVAAAVRGTALR
jgi:nucleoside 2-deoxyribosyltransferase